MLMQSISELIKEYRKSHNLTTQEMADIVGMSIASINQYERGLREPREKAIKKNIARN